MADISNFYQIPIDLQSFTTANFLADIRIKYEYQRSGHKYEYSATTQQLQDITNAVGFKGALSFGNIAFWHFSRNIDIQRFN